MRRPQGSRLISVPVPPNGPEGADVRFGSLADICTATIHVRFTPNSGHESGHGSCRATAPRRVQDNAAIHVRQRADQWGRIGKPKSKAGNRDIPLAPMAVNALRRWRDECPKGNLGLVFPNGVGNVESHQNITHRFWEPFQIANGMGNDSGKRDKAGNSIMEAKYGIHALRHAAASLFIAHLGWTPKRLQTVMGHSSIQMTFDLYGHLFEDREGDREAMKRLEAAIVAA
jgi:integrase